VVNALTGGGPALGYLLGKWLGSPAGSILSDALQIVSKEVIKGLELCINDYNVAGKPKRYKCGLTFTYIALPVPPFVIQENLKIETCYYDKKASDNYD
jgi:hypothetical protein